MALWFVVTLILATAAWGGEGDLDSSFGFGGFFNLPLPPLLSGDAIAAAVQVQSDQRIVVLATFSPVSGNSGMLIYRLLPNGGLDTSFGIGGMVILDADFGEPTPELAVALEIQSDGRLLIAGTIYFGGGNSDWIVTRLMPDGTIDPGFNGGLWQRIWFDYGGSRSDFLEAIAIDRTNGKIVLVGSATLSGQVAYAAVARLTASGDPDPGFGVGGKNFANFFLGVPGSSFSDVYDVLIEPGGGIVLAGAWTNYTAFYWVLARLSPDGFLDPSFAGDGILLGDFTPIVPSARRSFFTRLGQLSDGSYLAGGGFNVSSTSSIWVGLVRVDREAALVSSWGDNGYEVLPYEQDLTVEQNFLEGLAIDSTGRSVCAGRLNLGTLPTRIGYARLDSDGSLDSTFRGGGTDYFSFFPNAQHTFGDLTLDETGRILIVGSVDYLQPPPISALQYRVAVARLLGSNPFFRDGFESGDAAAWSSASQ